MPLTIYKKYSGKFYDPELIKLFIEISEELEPASGGIEIDTTIGS